MNDTQTIETLKSLRLHAMADVYEPQASTCSRAAVPHQPIGP